MGMVERKIDCPRCGEQVEYDLLCDGCGCDKDCCVPDKEKVMENLKERIDRDTKKLVHVMTHWRGDCEN